MINDDVNPTGIYNVADYGAKGNGTDDDSPAIAKAILDAASTGGIVWLPPTFDYYLCSTTLLFLSDNVTLAGAQLGTRSRTSGDDSDSPSSRIGFSNTTYAGITMSSGSTISGVEFYYPNQSPSGSTTISNYPAAITVQGDGCTIRDTTAINPYIFIQSTSGVSDITIDNVAAFPYLRGIYLTNVIRARISRVRFTPEIWTADNDGFEDTYISKSIASHSQAIVLDNSQCCALSDIFIKDCESGIVLGQNSSNDNDTMQLDGLWTEGVTSNVLYINLSQIEPDSGGCTTSNLFIDMNSDIVDESEDTLPFMMKLCSKNPGATALSLANVMVTGKHDTTLTCVKSGDSYGTVLWAGGSVTDVQTNIADAGESSNHVSLCIVNTRFDIAESDAYKSNVKSGKLHTANVMYSDTDG